MAGPHFVVVVNPRGGPGRGLAVLQEVKPDFESVGARLDVCVTRRAGQTAELARTADLSGRDGLCVIGGDGTIHEAVSGLIQRGQPVSTPLGVIPGGTGNSVCEHLGCTDPLEAARRIAAGNTRPLDVVRVTGGNEVFYCVNLIGWGAVADINRTAERLRWLGPLRYTASAIVHILRARRRRARVVLDDQVVEDGFLLVAGCNTKFTGKGMQLAPRAEIGDGMIDVVLVRRATRLQMLQLFRKVFDGSHLSLPFIEYHQVRSSRVESKRPDGLNLDGELKGATPMSAEVMPTSLRVFA
jgi:sphingosine kinase